MLMPDSVTKLMAFLPLVKKAANTRQHLALVCDMKVFDKPLHPGSNDSAVDAGFNRRHSAAMGA